MEIGLLPNNGAEVPETIELSSRAPLSVKKEVNEDKSIIVKKETIPKNSVLRRKLNKVFSELLKKDRNDLVFWHELDKSKIKNNDDLRNVMEQQDMFHGDGLKRFLISLKDIRFDLYMEFVESSKDDIHVDDSKVHERFNRFLLKICNVMCQKENRKILKELKTIFRKILPGNQLEKADARAFMELMKKRGIIRYDSFDRLTSNIKSILKERYDKVIGYLVKEYETDMANEKGEFATGSIKKDVKEEKSFEYNVTVTSDSEGKLTLTENVNTVSIDSSPNANEMEDVINKSPSCKKRCIPNNSLEYGNSNNEESYAMASNPHGNCLIFNNYFENNIDFSRRNGTEKDEEKLVSLFKWLQFYVTTYNNCSAEEIKQKLLSVAEDEKNYNHDCLVVIILSHGFEGGVNGNDGKKLTFNSITEIFEECEALIGKPKLYIIQACQGKKDVVTVSRDVDTPAIPTLQPPKTNTRTPIKADQVMFLAAPPGHCSYRCGEYGSWFIQDFCTVVEKHAKSHSLLALTTKTTNLMSKNEGRVEDKLVTGLPCIKDLTLRKLFYFKPMGAFKEYKEKLTEENMSMVYE